MSDKSSKEQVKNWREEAKRKEKQAKEYVESFAKNYNENPEIIAEYLEFGSRFYNYSPRNVALIYSQNRGATYIQSFKAWNDMDRKTFVNKGEHGIMVFVPVQSTLLKVDENDYIPLRDATKEQKRLYKEGQIESISSIHFKIGTVFDIAQTDYPKELYPQLFNMGYQSEEHKQVFQALATYCEKQLGCSVTCKNLHSIALRGQYIPGINTININDKLEDTQALSVLSHEMGHALIHSDITNKSSTFQKEYEADAVSIMLQSHLGIELLDSRKRHFAEHFENFKKQCEYDHNDVEDKEQRDKLIQKDIDDSFATVFSTFNKHIYGIEKQIHKKLENYIEQKNDYQFDTIMARYKRKICYVSSADIQDLQDIDKDGKGFESNGKRVKYRIEVIDMSAEACLTPLEPGNHFTSKKATEVHIKELKEQGYEYIPYDCMVNIQLVNARIEQLKVKERENFWVFDTINRNNGEWTNKTVWFEHLPENYISIDVIGFNDKNKVSVDVNFVYNNTIESENNFVLDKSSPTYYDNCIEVCNFVRSCNINLNTLADSQKKQPGAKFETDETDITIHEKALESKGFSIEPSIVPLFSKTGEIKKQEAVVDRFLSQVAQKMNDKRTTIQKKRDQGLER